MSYQQENCRLSLYFVTAIILLAVILGGCAPQIQKPVRLCPGAESAMDSLSLLRLRSENTAPLKANGQCLLQYYDEDKKYKEENFPVKLWANPPAEIYMQGDVAFDAKGVVLGSNENEFWLSMKPKASTYVWGQWSDEVNPEELMINPKLVLEALGITEIGREENWSVSNEDDFDVLIRDPKRNKGRSGTTERDGSNDTRKIHISNSDCLVKRIEYFNGDQLVVVTKLSNYKQITEGFFVPSLIKIAKGTAQAIENSVRITLNLKSIKLANITESQRNHLFTRPEPQGFEYIYKIINGNMVEQPQ